MTLRESSPDFELSPRVLLQATYLTTGGLTSLLDRMESAGLVERRPDSVDRRGIIVPMTERGRSVVDEAAGEITRLERSLAEQLPDAERELFADLVARYVMQLDRLPIAPR